MRPSVFIGSSTEGLEYARAVRGLIQDAAEATVWNEGFFGPGTTIIERLAQEADRFDFAVVILTPDDLLASQARPDGEGLTPRDNVIFELGLFMGSLGRTRTFLLLQ